MNWRLWAAMLSFPAVVVGLVLAVVLGSPRAAEANAGGSGTCRPGVNCTAARFTATSNNTAHGIHLRYASGSAAPVAWVSSAGSTLASISYTAFNQVAVSGSSGLNAASFLLNSTGTVGINDSTNDLWLIAATGGLHSLRDSAGTVFATASTAGVRLPGKATGSLATCGAGIYGTLQYDTTHNGLMTCEPVGATPAWRRVARVNSSTFAGYTTSNVELRDFGGTVLPDPVDENAAYANGHIVFVPSVVGVGAGTAILAVYNGNENMCELSMSCTAAVGTIQEGATCPSTATGGDTLTLRWGSESDCTTLPQGMANARVWE